MHTETHLRKLTYLHKFPVSLSAVNGLDEIETTRTLDLFEVITPLSL